MSIVRPCLETSDRSTAGYELPILTDFWPRGAGYISGPARQGPAAASPIRANARCPIGIHLPGPCPGRGGRCSCVRVRRFVYMHMTLYMHIYTQAIIIIMEMRILADRDFWTAV